MVIYDDYDGGYMIVPKLGEIPEWMDAFIHGQVWGEAISSPWG
jgi:hypothetical protein